MKIQVKDCANGGVFQMEPARADATATVFTHVLGDGVFYSTTRTSAIGWAKGFRAPASCPMAGRSCVTAPIPTAR